MSTIVIVSVCVAIAAVIGLRVYFEQKEEKEFEKLKQQVEEDKKTAGIFVQEEAIAAEQPVAIDEPKADIITAPLVDIEPINSAAAELELKPKKKKRYYYPKKKKAAIKATPKKQDKK